MELKIPSLPFTKEKAIKVYTKLGGIVKQEQGKLIYPDKIRIKQQLEAIEKKLSYLNPSIAALEEKQKQLSLINISNFFKVASDSLFWKHYLRELLDEDYRKTSKIVSPPIRRINDEKYRKIMKQFLENDEYRKSLLEAKTSIINESTLSESIEKSIRESKKLIKIRIDKLKKEKREAIEKKKALETFLNWVG